MSRGILCALALLTCFGCYGEDVVGNYGVLVGGECRDSRDCDDVCLRGGDFPDGTCSVECRDDRDCPRGTACIDKQGGVCLLLCDRNADCRHRYQCDDQRRRGHSGHEYVCIDD
jgi:hypothetical protein